MAPEGTSAPKDSSNYSGLLHGLTERDAPPFRVGEPSLTLSGIMVFGVGDTSGGVQSEYDGISSIQEPPATDYVPHAPIRIDDNTDFAAVASSGDGSSGNPWVIKGWDIDGTGFGYCIYIGNTTDYFVVRNCYLHDASGGGSDWPFFYDAGLFMFMVQNGKILDNTVSNNVEGIWDSWNGGNVIEGNTVSSNTNVGIGIFGCWVSDVVRYNTVSSNADGITFSMSSNHVVSGNTVSLNPGDGVYLITSSSNTIINNTLQGNGNGIYLDEFSFEGPTQGNNIYHNNFIGNTQQAHEHDDGIGGANFWDNGYPSGGNYWSDFDEAGEGAFDGYSGTNQNILGPDGIVDSNPGLNPYPNIGGGAGAQDIYPLIEPMGLPEPSAYDIPIPVVAEAGDWVFISFPYAMSGNIETVLDDSVYGGGGTTWSVAKWYNPQTPADPWKTYRFGSNLNDLATINNQMGVWIRLDTHDGGTLTTGTIGDYSTTDVVIQLYAGWNLVSYPSAISRVGTDTLPIEVDFVAYYDAAAPYLITDDLAPGDVTFSEGNAYWVHMPSNVPWSVVP